MISNELDNLPLTKRYVYTNYKFTADTTMIIHILAKNLATYMSG